MNLYGFAGGDPVNFSDPFGLCPTCENEATLKIQVEGVEKRTGRDVAVLFGAGAVAAAGGAAILAAGTGAMVAATAASPILPVIPSALGKLQVLGEKFGVSAGRIANQTLTQGQRMVDAANNGNINAILPRLDGASGFIRVTLDPSQSRIISAGLQTENQVKNGLASGRFTPIAQ